MSESGDWAAPGYTEIRELGSGATGRVVLAREDAGGRLVAIKYLAARLVGDHVFAERFRREAELMALVRDPNVVEVYGLVIAPDGRGVALVMEAVEGPTLRTLLGRGHGSPEAALSLLRGSLLGLAAAHDRGVVHRDYKPDNVLVDARGRSKLTDFGIASPAWQGAPAEGTPAYMAPEQWNGYPPAPASDMYSAAVVFYECLTGVRPFRSETLAELRTLHESARPPLDQIPPPVRALLERGLAKYPDQRYGDVRTFLADVEAAAFAGYGADWLERGVRDLAYVAAGLVAALPLLALAAGTTAGTIGVAGAAGAASAVGAGTAGAVGAGGAAGGAASAVGAGAAGVGGAGVGAAGGAAGAGAGAAGAGAGAAGQAGIQGAIQAGQAGGQAVTQAAGHAATQAAGHLGAQAAGHGAAAQAFGGVAAGHGAAAAQTFGQVGHVVAGHAAVHGSTAAGQVLGDASGHAAQAAQHTRRAARWTRHGAKLMHGKALVATVATVTVAAAGTGVVVATAGSGGDAKTSVAQAEESALHAFGRGDYAAMCGEMSAAMLKMYSGSAGCLKIMASANGFVSTVGASLADQRKAASAAAVDASQVTVTGDTAVVPASAVHGDFGDITVMGQSVQFHINDVTWVKEDGRWKIGTPKNLPSVLPTVFPTDFPTDFPTNFPTDFPTNLPTDFLSDLPTDLPTGLPTG
ncbi:hypothetical protein ABIA31_009059 [Catenulispora sp. MAP5-51]|uniref:protein kinase domain-containing protein n=1 Tax=Catenulispora sp. MAP5-51 TaxID=3156298 RepID=UPI003512867C